ncbi:MAG: hypothetical protein ACXVLQ_03295 [Bacteriovorax sp.]
MLVICGPTMVHGAEEPSEGKASKGPDNPFLNACKNPDDLRDVVTWFIYKAPPDHDHHGVKSSELLQLVAEKVAHKIEINRKMALKLKECQESNFTDDNCGPSKKWIEVDLRNYIKETRLHLALAQSTYHTSTMLQILENDINYQQSSLGSYKEVRWRKLDKAERASVDSKWSAITSSFKKSYEGMPASDLKQLLLADRVKHFVQYQEHMAQVPLMQYFESYDYTPESFLNSVNLFLESLDSESEKFNQVENNLSVPRHEITDDDLYLLKYNGLVEEVLTDRPEYCSVASTLAIYQKRKQMVILAETGLPILAVSFLAPPLIGTSVGVLSTAYYAINAQRDFNESKERNLTKIYDGKGNIDELAELRSYYRERNLKVFMVPLSIGGFTATGEKILNASNNAIMAKKIISVISKYLL